MYESPMTATIQNIAYQAANDLNNQIMNVLFSYDIKVDKEELIKALAYDRDQYDKGYADAKAEIVYCKDCDFWCEDMKAGRPEFGNVCAPCEVWSHREDSYVRYTEPDDFCSYGEKRAVE